MKLQYEPTIERLRQPPDDQRVGGTEPGWAIWQATDGKDVPIEDEAQPKPVLTEPAPATDSLVAQYFGDVRQFALLTRTEEEALWRHIEHLKKRVRRALYTAPICLSTLQKLWQRVEQGDLSLRHVVAETPSITDPNPAQVAPFEASIRSLQELTRRLQRLKARQQRCVANRSQARRAMRQACADVWHQWIATCEALRLQPSVHEELHRALGAALRDQPDDLALRAARRGWSRTQGALEEAKAQMLRANLRLVIYIAKRYLNDEVPFLDLVQEGNIGLMRGLEKFEPSRGLKFATYAYWWVRQAIGRALVEQRRTVRLPGHVVERKNKLRAAKTKFWQVYKRAPTPQELSAELGWPPQDVEILQDTGQVMVRLHEPLSEEGRRLEETMEDQQSPDPYAVVAQRELQQRMAACLSGLPEREAHILRLRFGLDTDRPQTLSEIGDLYGLSRERIRQLETLALKKLRGSIPKALLADFVDAA